MKDLQSYKRLFQEKVTIVRKMGGVNLLKISTIVFLWATLAYALDEVAVDLNTGDHRADEVIGKSPVSIVEKKEIVKENNG